MIAAGGYIDSLDGKADAVTDNGNLVTGASNTTYI